MKKFLLIAAASVVGAAPAVAQTTSCPAFNPLNPPSDSVAASNSVQQAADLFQFIAPEVSQAVAGGNSTLGLTSTLGGLGHFSVGLHATAVAGSVPDVTKFPTCYTGRQNAQPLPTTKSAIPMVGADAAIGIFGGLPLALTNVGGIDLLLSAEYVPEKTFSNVSVKTPDGSLQIGYGARVGILSESILVPGVSVSYMKRDLPRVTVNANTGNGDSLIVTGLKMKTSSWRLEASKSLIFFGVAAGLGQDKFDSSLESVHVSANTPLGQKKGNLGVQTQQLTRTNYFLNASFGLLLAKITAEIGQSTGGTVTTYNSFDGAQPAGTRTYGSLGVRVGL